MAGRLMAKITITLRDASGGQVGVSAVCDPPPAEDAEATPAQAEAVAVLEWLRERAEECNRAWDQVSAWDQAGGVQA